MPRIVDAQTRQTEIARAAFKIARRSSLSEVTFRSVANELGTSTTAVTHYAPTRAELLRLLVLYAFGTRERLATKVLRRLSPRPAFSLLVEFVLPIRDEARIFARIYLETLTEAEQQPELRHALAAHDQWLARELEEILGKLDLVVPLADAVDIGVTSLDGIMCTAITSPDAWPPARQRRAAKNIARLLGLGNYPRTESCPPILEDEDLEP